MTDELEDFAEECARQVGRAAAADRAEPKLSCASSTPHLSIWRS